ncbi:MAG: glycosyltransferase family 4 protein [Chloroflexota bacterium]|nr:glycosyltransferase family 4 protein [Chloroflexota bacterium]
MGTVDLRLIAFRYFPAVGGAEQLARRLLLEVSDRLTADVLTLITSNRSEWLRLLIDGERAGASTYTVDGRRVRVLGSWSRSARARMRLLAPFYHLPKSPVPTAMAAMLAPELEPMVRGARLVHNVFMGREAFSLGSLLAARRLGLRFVFTPLRHERPLGWNSPAFRTLYRLADAVIALTDVERRWLINQGAHPDRTHVIGLGPTNDPQASPAPARTRVGPGKFVLFLGQLHGYKGFRVLIETARAFADRRDVRFVFAGPDVRGQARAFAGAPANVLYLGQVDPSMRDSLLQACTVLCVPSSRESFGAVLVEAWSCGKPVIGGPAAATRELIDEGIDGWTVPANPRAIAGVLSRLLDDEALGHRAGAAGRAKVAARFSWPAIAGRHLEIYQPLLARAERPT